MESKNTISVLKVGWEWGKDVVNQLTRHFDATSIKPPFFLLCLNEYMSQESLFSPFYTIK